MSISSPQGEIDTSLTSILGLALLIALYSR